MYKGIDVSEHQGNINWQKVKNTKQVDFAILRAGYGKEISQKDKQFENNYKGCKENNIPCGVYWYSYATDEESAKKEAATCIEAIKGKQFEYPIYFDVEENRQFALGSAKVSSIIATFCNELEKAGYWVGLYMSASPLSNYATDYIKKRYAIWVAHYNVAKPSYSGSYGMWQKSSNGKIDGINGNVDVDECYVDYCKSIKEAGLNGFPKSTANAQPASSTKPKELPIKIEVDGVAYSGILKEVDK